MLEIFLSNDKSLEVNVAISRKKLCCMIFDKKNDRKWGEPKTQNWQCVLADQLTLYQPEGADCAPYITTCPPDLVSFLRPCKVKCYP